LTRLVSAILLAGALFASGQDAGASSQCGGGEVRAAAKKADGKLKCWARATDRGVAADGLCLGNAETKFSTAYTKAQTKIDCPATVAASTIEGKVDAFVADVVTAIDGGTGTPPRSTCSAKEIAQASKKAIGLLKCFGRAIAKGAPPDTACIDKVTSKFQAGWLKATAAADCATAVAEDAVETTVDDFAANVTATVSPLFIAELGGHNEVPPVNTPGSGAAVVTLDTVAHTMKVDVVFEALLATSTAADIHCCSPTGMNSGVATPVPAFPVGVTAASYLNTVDLPRFELRPRVLDERGRNARPGRGAPRRWYGEVAHLLQHPDDGEPGRRDPRPATVGRRCCAAVTASTWMTCAGQQRERAPIGPSLLPA
jgi:hypothetical protein